MPDINLIGSERQELSRSRSLGSLLTGFFVLILILFIAYYGFLLFRGRQLAKDITSTQAKIVESEAKIRNNSEKNEVFTRQAQIADLKTLLATHLNWSRVVPELARVTLRSASYTDFLAESGNNIVMTVEVPNYVELDKFLQVFDLPQYSQNISHVKIRSIAKIQQEDSLKLRAKIEFTYNEDSLKLQAATK